MIRRDAPARETAPRPDGLLAAGDASRHEAVARHVGRIVGVATFDQPDASLVVALAKAGALGVLDLGRDPAAARVAVAAAARQAPQGFGVRVPAGVAIDAASLPPAVTTIVLAGAAMCASWPAREGVVVLAQVTSLDEALVAVAGGADGLVVKGSESGGRVGEETAFVLLQHVAGAVALPIWVQGGVGVHTAAACIAGGAYGVVLDAQLALLREARVPEATQAAIAAMDGSETVVVGEHRVYTRPDLAVARMASATPDEVAARLGADLALHLVPAGQDGAFARPLAARFRTAAGLVHGLRDAIATHLRAAREHAVIGPSSPLAIDHAVRYPIAQGPMTRVSDGAAFADAVSLAGGLPFLALSLMRGAEVRALVSETSARLGPRSWGVGILGFVPDEAREEQLAVLRELKPPVAIIAGGRPAQARPLEAQGTATYLHVPSPGLLDLFLAEGARRFVFEGRECGGHVGPRTSFVLWETQIERLLAFLDPRAQKGKKAADAPRADAVSVLFAGGIHDARSAAMVSAMAAPLAALGVKVGVLMGTAYLFTDEAVSSGAIMPGFQAAAIACERTSLLETAPGHATRCVETDFVRAFAGEKLRLEAEGTSPDVLWATLEQLNLGRLRIAAKGVRRQGAELVGVDRQTQEREGMFMVGQVAALRAERVTMADLHRDVSEGGAARAASFEAVERELAPVDTRPRTPPADVAIVGMAGIFPGAPDLETYWANIVLGVNAITEVPKERWDAAVYYDATSMNGEKTPSKWGGFLAPVPFDPLAYGIPPRSLAAIEPVQLLSLEVAARALRDAGYEERAFDRERTSVVFGAEGGTDLSNAYGFRALYPQMAGPMPAALGEHLPALTEDSFPGVLANVIAGRIANRLDLGGVNYTVDAACASSLAAIDVAVKELASGASDMVLCGGADMHNGIHDFLMFASVHALSPTGQCKTFDAAADGIVLGEGVGCLVLKRLADAERDGDRVYAVIKGIAGGSDGRSLGLTAPRKEGQVRAVHRAYERAGVSPRDVGLVEAHGTGTVVGDQTELATLTEVFGASGAPPGSCALGSVKSQIGHTKCAAGIAGLIKSALAIHHRVLPPTMHVKKPNAYYDRATSPFAFSDVALPWAADERRAAVSAFGFGGTNFHCILEGKGDGAASGLDAWPCELVLLRGASREAAVRVADRLAGLLDQDEPTRLRDVAFTLASMHGRVHAAIVARDVDDLRAKLAAARAALTGSTSALPEGVTIADVDAAPPGGVAFLFPGQGSQRPRMLRELFIAFPQLSRLLRAGARWAPTLFPPQALTPADRAAEAAAITDTRVAQPSLGIADLAMADVLALVGVKPDMLGGHSYGELVALTVAGAIDERYLLDLSFARASCILDAAGDDPGAMAAVTAGAADVARALGAFADVVVANENAPDQTVIAGPTASVDAAVAALEARGIAARRIQVACAFHSPVIAGARDALAGHLAALPVATPRHVVYSNTTAAPYPTEPDAIRARIADHVVRPVLFARQIEAMYASGARVFVEVGPGRALSGLVGRTLGDRPHRAIACDQSAGSGLSHLLSALGQLATLGVSLDARPLFTRRGAARIDLDRAPRVRAPQSAWLVNGRTSWPLGGDVPAGGLQHATAPIVATQATVIAAPEDAVVVEYLRGMRELARSQRDVMLRFLGSAPSVDAVSEAIIEARVEPATSRAITVVHAPPIVALATASIADTLLTIVSDRTGYPIEMLDLDLNLEAELSIDSIKRIEILGVLSARLGLTSESEAARPMIEQLARVKTLRGILDFLDAQREAAQAGEPMLLGAGRPTLPSPAPPAEAAFDGRVTLVSGPPPPDLLAATSSPPQVPVLVRRVLRGEPRPLPAMHAGALVGRSYVITDDGRGLAPMLVDWLASRGADARVIVIDAPLGPEAAVIHLAGLAHHEATHAALPGIAATRGAALLAFELVKRAVEAQVPSLLAATWSEPSPLPDGIGGLLRSVAREAPEMGLRAVGLDAGASREALVEQIGAEIAAVDDHVESRWVGGVREVVVAREATLPEIVSPRVRLDASSVVVVTGGARGITARVAVALAERHGCKLEIIGRTPLPGEPEAADLADAADAKAIRKVLLARGELRVPSAIEAATSRVLALREVRATLLTVARLGAAARYHAVDVRDDQAFGAVLDDVLARHGRIDGVVHGAGVIEDKLLAHKTRGSFERVFDTKVAAALTLAERLGPSARFVAFFASVSGAFGNAGQADYAAANDALDRVARHLATRTSARVVSFDWGPWSGAGMVSSELEREYTRRGVGLVEADEGCRAFLDELDRGGADDTQVLLMKGDPAGAFAPPRSRHAQPAVAAETGATL